MIDPNSVRFKSLLSRHNYVLSWIHYHLIPLNDLIIINEGINSFIYVCGGYLCVEAIKSVNSQ